MPLARREASPGVSPRTRRCWLLRLEQPPYQRSDRSCHNTGGLYEPIIQSRRSWLDSATGGNARLDEASNMTALVALAPGQPRTSFIWKQSS